MKATQRPVSATPEILTGGGEMGSLVRAKDWSQTPLGPVESWPQSLRTTVSLCLASNFPISIAWGPARVQIYNDGYWPICGGKHPTSMGQDFKECWFSAWPAIGEAFERASAGQTSFLENQRMFLDRNGYLEETFFTFSFSPIRDETGGVGGLFHPVTELTQQALMERRLSILRDVAERTADTKSVAEACAAITQTLALYDLDLPFALLYLVDTDGRQARLAGRAGLAAGTPASPFEVDLVEGGPTGQPWPLADLARSGRTERFDDLELRLAGVPCGPYPESPRTAMVLPIGVPGLERPLALLVAGVSSRRALDEAYQTFYELLRQAVSSALTKARVYEEERTRAEALAELDRAKTAFFSNVSHELRTPLTLLLGPIEDVLAAQDGPAPRDRATLAMAHRNGLHLLRLVNTLLDFSRLEAGRAQAVFEPLDLSSFTAELASAFRSVAEKASLRLVVDCPKLPVGTPAIYADRGMWEKIVLNLLSNAFKFTFEGEVRVAFRLDADSDRVELVVQDTGVGIPAEEVPHLFERFHRVRGARSRTHEGTGIGLALVKELVEFHAGEIAVESVPGRGTTFRITLPSGGTHAPAGHIRPTPVEPPGVSTSTGATAYVEEALRWIPDAEVLAEDAMAPGAEPYLSLYESHSGAPAREPGPPLEEGGRVLVVDDNADMRQYLARLLAVRYDVETAADGAAALAQARARPPDLVLSDVMMPGLDGFQLLAALRDDARTRAVPVVLLSALAGEEARVEGLDRGADDYLVKPFSARELLARVSANLELARLRRTLAEATERARAEAELRELNEQLEQRVLDRTTELVHVMEQLRRNGEELEVASKRKSEFLASMSHELRTPLNAIIGFAEIMLDHDLTEIPYEQRKSFLDHIERSGQHLLGVINDVLDLSKVEAGHMELYLERVTLADLIEDCVTMMRVVADDKGISLLTSYEPADRLVSVDPGRMRQIVYNLLSNAIKFTAEGGRVTVDARVGEREAVVAVRDTGIGIAPEDQELIFEEFRQAHRRSSMHRERGTGLGLALVRQLVKLHGGRIEMESTPGQGSCFTFSIPRLSPEGPIGPEGPTGPEGQGQPLPSQRHVRRALDPCVECKR